MHSPSLTYFGLGKMMLKYLKGTIDFGSWYTKSDGKLEGYVNSNWVYSIDDSKSTTRFVFSFRSGVFLELQKARCSYSIARYIVATTSSNQVIWTRKVLDYLNHMQETPTHLWCDNSSMLTVWQVYQNVQVVKTRKFECR